MENVNQAIDSQIEAILNEGNQELLDMNAVDREIEALMNEDDDLLLAAARRYEQQGGNPLFRADFTAVGRNRSFRDVIVKKKYRLTFDQLGDPQEEPLGKALSEAVIQGLQRVVQNEGFNIQDYSLLVALHSNSFNNGWLHSARNVPLEDWLTNGEYTRSFLEDSARKLNSAQMIDPQQDGFYVELTFVKNLGRGGKNGGKKGNPGKAAWEKLAKKKRCIVPENSYFDKRLSKYRANEF